MRKDMIEKVTMQMDMTAKDIVAVAITLRVLIDKDMTEILTLNKMF